MAVQSGAPDTEAVRVAGEADGSEGVTRALIARMRRLGVSRSELARRLGTSPAYVTKILRGDTNFTLASLARIAAALGAEVELRLSAAATGDARPARPRAPVRREPRPAGAPAASATPARRPSPDRSSRPVPGSDREGWRVW